MEERKLTCIGCPKGCLITVKTENGNIISIEGNTCPVGENYAKNEILNPVRTLTSTVTLKDGELQRLPVKTKGEIPKDKLMAVMEKINEVIIDAPVNIGDIIIKNVCETGIDVIATRSAPKK